MPNIQDIELDVISTYDVAASALVDGAPVALKDLTIVVVDGEGVVVGVDADPSDANDDVDTNASVGAVTLMTMTGRGVDDNWPYEAIVRATNREAGQEPREMAVTFTKRAA